MMQGVYFIAAPIKVTLPHRKPASAVAIRDRCIDQDSDKRNLLYTG
jgi:hypothetical protein